MKKTDNIKIAVSGKSGCGNTTVSSLVAKYLGLKFINYTFHNMAKERGMDFKELCRLAETDNSYDIYLDKKQVKMASKGNCVLGSRLAIWMLKDADLKIFLTASPEVRAKRIADREWEDYKNILIETVDRDKRDRERYLKLYGIDNNNYVFADLIVDTGKITQYEVAEKIISRVKEKYSI